ncbi:MAG TPA: acetolactate synthase small subunit, partial [Candidatus Hydrogenedentes bacterium]|nr:acetolactate synthase small subunit [Candidatus Hydrogenedentota bacterium]
TRGYNIDSLCVGETENPAISRMTVVVRGDDEVIHQIINQLNKLVEVIEVTDLSKESYVERELVMIKVTADGTRREIIEIASIFRAKVIDVGSQSLIVEVTGSEGKVNAFIDMMRPFGIQELARTGEIAVMRAPKGSQGS